MRVLTKEEFLLKITKTAKIPRVWLRPNQHLMLSIPEGDGTVRTWLGPDPVELGFVTYLNFLTEVDKTLDIRDPENTSKFSHAYLGDRWRY